MKRLPQGDGEGGQQNENLADGWAGLVISARKSLSSDRMAFMALSSVLVLSTAYASLLPLLAPQPIWLRAAARCCCCCRCNCCGRCCTRLLLLHVRS